MKIKWYSRKVLELLKWHFLPGAKYMNEPKISRYLRKPANTVSQKAGDAGNAAEKR